MSWAEWETHESRGPEPGEEVGAKGIKEDWLERLAMLLITELTVKRLEI